MLQQVTGQRPDHLSPGCHRSQIRGKSINKPSSIEFMIKKLRISALICCLILPALLKAQDFYSTAQRKEWLDKAELNKPRLVEQEKKPIGLVKLVADQTAFQGWK